jgi:hypothetical protein
LVHHPPLFRLSAVPGTFRVAPYAEAESQALLANPVVYYASTPQGSEEEQPEVAKLVSKLPNTKQSARPARNLPLRFTFPHFGPSIFLMSELTSENQIPAIEFDFARDRKRGER